jgi:hypothetical protein
MIMYKEWGTGVLKIRPELSAKKKEVFRVTDKEL